uniref:UPF0235 protein Cag_0319 n=1 Tax=Chlorobium chlorochromatii (strain CaD3) TaxID=340177 RepID=Y319_CHLCH|nr:RecName: Full=UPF0235 protein Cag_0319 [Chlorobium chlorochromatii CaD3]
MVELQEKNGSVCIAVRAQPRSSKSMVSGEWNGALKVHLQSPPVDDAANEECCRLLARLFQVPPSRVHLVAGHSSRNKRVMVEGVSAAMATELLQPFLHT